MENVFEKDLCRRDFFSKTKIKKLLIFQILSRFYLLSGSYKSVELTLTIVIHIGAPLLLLSMEEEGNKRAIRSNIHDVFY